MDIKDFCRKYGYRGLSCVVEEFIRRAPGFPGDLELAEALGKILVDLESGLKNCRLHG